MIRKLPFCILLFIFSSARTQSFIFADQFHGNDSQINAGSATDASGNIFTICDFWADVDANPGAGTTSFTSFGSQDVALVKLNSAGAFIWGAHIGGTGFEAASEIKTDAAGNVFIFGYFNGTIDMDPSIATYNLVSAGSDDLFCAKYDASGNLVWAKHIGGTGTEQNYGFNIDASGNCYLLGYFQNTVDFDTGPGTFNLTSTISVADFLLKMDNNGNFIWVKPLSTCWGEKLTFDASDNIYITGHFWGTVDFNPGPAIFNLTAFGFGSDAMAFKLDNAGNFIWASVFSGTMDDLGIDISVNDAENSAVVVGNFQGTLDCDPGIATANINAAGYVDGFIIKINATTGTYIWGKNIGAAGWQSVDCVKIDASGNIHMLGSFEQTVDFDPGAGTANLTSAGSTDVFRLVWTTAGNYTAAEKIGGINGDWPQSLELDDIGSELITGQFEGLVDFDPGAGTFNLNSAFTGWDGFLAKYCTSYTINNNVAICNGESYFAGGAWQNTAGDYYDYYTPAFGCDSTVITHLTINTPVVNLGTDDGICSGTTVILDAANPGATFLWNTGATTQTLSVSTAGTYSVTITDGAGCTASDAINISVDPSPVADLGPDISVCAGSIITLDAGNPGANYLWNTGATTKTIHPTTTGNYSVTVTNAFGCSDNDAVHVTFNPLPEVDLGADVGICSGENITLDAENIGADYTWTTGATTQTIMVTEAGNYGVTVTNGFGCSAGDTIHISVNPTPVVDLGPDVEICEGESVLLDAGNPGADFSWNTGAITQTINASTSGNYSVIVTNAFGCAENDMMHVTVHPVPVVDLGGTISFCENANAILDADNIGSDYIWSTGETTQQIIIDEAGTYSVTVTNAFGCSATDLIDATTLTAPVVDAGPDQSFCDGNAIIINAEIPLADNYLWNTGETTSSITVIDAGEYIVTATNIYGCSDMDTVIVDVLPVPDVTLSLPATVICTDDAAFILSGGSPSGGSWSGDGISDSTFDPAIAGIGDHLITYTYTNDPGCTATASENITVDICQGIEPISADIELFPNPAMNYFLINTHGTNTYDQMSILDITGKIIMKKSLDAADQHDIDIKELPAGNYIIQLLGDDKMISKQLIITR